MDSELVAMTRAVDPVALGRRVRDARVALGLTQGQLAGKEMSTAYVSRIESGQRRPDPLLLVGLATRLKVNVDELLLGATRGQIGEQRLALDWAQLALTTGDAAGALARVDSVLVELPQPDSNGMQREALHVRALALEATGSTQDAIMLMEDLADAGPIDLIWARGLIALSRSYRESGDLARAIETGERAVAPLADLGLEDSDEAIRLTLSLAASYFERGDGDYAARLSRRALDRAERANLPGAKAAAYWNASNIEFLRGNVVAALPMASKAVALLELSDDAKQVARLRTQLGMLELSVESPDADQALAHLQQAEADLAYTDATPLDRAANHVYQARAHFALGDLSRAEEIVDTAVAESANDAPLIAAQANALGGQIAVARGDRVGARLRYQQAVFALTSMGVDHGTAQLWFELATLLEGSGDDRGALNALKHAAASAGLRTPFVHARTSSHSTR